MKHPKKYAHLRCYHAIPLENLSFNEIVPDPKYSDTEDCEYQMDYRTAFQWLEQQIGFYPCFMAIGNGDAHEPTGYYNNWSRVLTVRWENGVRYATYRAKGDFFNRVMLVYDIDVVEEPAVFIDSTWWDMARMDVWNNHGQVTKDAYRRCFMKSRNRTDWLRAAHRDGTDVQVVVPKMDPRKACEVWVRNKRTKKHLEALGFRNVIVKRVPIRPVGV